MGCYHTVKTENYSCSPTQQSSDTDTRIDEGNDPLRRPGNHAMFLMSNLDL